LRVLPVVVVTGARQTAKTTLVRCVVLRSGTARLHSTKVLALRWNRMVPRI